MSYTKDIDVVFIGAGRLVGELRGVCADLTALGHISRTFWIDAGAQEPGRGDTGSMLRKMEEPVEQARSCESFVRLSDALREMRGLILVVHLVDPHEETDYEAVDQWMRLIQSEASHNSVRRVRMLMPQLPLPTTEPAHREGWATVALTAFDSDSPLTSSRRIQREDGPLEVARAYAPSVLGLCGRFSAAPVVGVLKEDGSEIIQGLADSFVLARCFFRDLDASDAEEELRDAVIAVSEDIPVTHMRDGRQTVPQQHSEEMVRRYAYELLQAHQSELLTQEEPPKSAEQVEQSGAAAVKAFLREFFRATVGSRSIWSSSLQQGVADRMRDMLQKGLYGEESTIRVVMGQSGRRTGGEASIEKLRSSSAQLMKTSSKAGIEVGRQTNLSSLWADYCDASLTLIDGSDRLHDRLPNLVDNSNPAVVGTSAEVVPDSDRGFDAGLPILDEFMKREDSEKFLHSYDAVRVHSFDRKLTKAVARTSDPEVLDLREDFQQWRDRNGTSFASEVGSGLLDYLSQAQQRVGSAWEAVKGCEQALSQLGSQDTAAINRRLTSKLRMLSGVWAVIMLVLIYCCIRYYKPDWRVPFESWQGLNWQWTVLLAVVSTAIIVAVQMSVFAKARRGVYDLLRQRQLQEQNLEIHMRNYYAALGDVSRITDAYQQFLAWSLVLGRVLAYPFGAPRDSRVKKEIPTSGMPRSARLGRAVADPEKRRELTHTLRQSLCREGWAGSAFERTVGELARQVASNTGGREQRVSDLYGLNGLGSGSALDRLAQCAAETIPELSEQEQQRWIDALGQENTAEYVHSYLPQASFFEQGREHTVDRSEFFAGLVEPDRADVEFPAEALSALGATKGATSIDQDKSGTHYSDSRRGTLTRSVIKQQFGSVAKLSVLVPLAESTAPVEDFNPSDAEFPGEADFVWTAFSSQKDTFPGPDSARDSQHSDGFPGPSTLL
ncbi:hypothetical protein CCICO_10225 [Corynebacterium ciconiae DSM 44920]|uniref:hypothetical protein n=1 Tax=Corynebacterium ciconiae TaxID=227319 RepID=UPI00035CB7AB|nr:hypothetical protein [Corynebacterium ciconiae]WKD62044.1 hypothetical protein CCICO_10225 [Corynebacterium ciconiae DSM 44920]